MSEDKWDEKARRLWLGRGKDALNFGDDPDEPEQTRSIKIIARALRESFRDGTRAVALRRVQP